MSKSEHTFPVYMYSPEEDVGKRLAVRCETPEQVNQYTTLGWIFNQTGPVVPESVHPEPESVPEPPDMAVPENIPIRHPEPINHKRGPGRPRKDHDE